MSKTLAAFICLFALCVLLAKLKPVKINTHSDKY